MAKHHKRNTRFRFKKRLENPYDVSKYDDMDKQRLEIKRLLYLQEQELWKQSHRRKRFYYKQISRFKYYYVIWKRRTYYTYLYVRFGVPFHLIEGLKFFQKTHNISSIIYNL